MDIRDYELNHWTDFEFSAVVSVYSYLLKFCPFFMLSNNSLYSARFLFFSVVCTAVWLSLLGSDALGNDMEWKLMLVYQFLCPSYTFSLFLRLVQQNNMQMGHCFRERGTLFPAFSVSFLSPFIKCYICSSGLDALFWPTSFVQSEDMK